MEILFKFLKIIKAMNEDGNDTYVRILHPIGFLFLLISAVIIMPVFCLFTENAIQNCWYDILEAREIRFW